MNWIDILLGAIILIFVIRGVFKGLFREGAGLLGVLVGLIVAINRYQQLGEAIHNELQFLSLKICNIISFALIFGGIAIIGAIAGIIVHNILSRHPIRGIEEGGGFILGLLEGALICSVILILLSISPFSAKFDRWSEGSILKPYLSRVGPFIYDSIVSVTPGEAKKFMEKLDPSQVKHSIFNNTG
ncbi:CvpA family protein [Candidatus Aerophobetes bacterium]|nr:CvpA family protein [Candidatus Aerophobetes bacterium]